MNVVIGLGEYGYPPTLLYPISIHTIINSNTITIKKLNNSQVVNWLQNSTDQEILDFIYKHYE